MIVIGNTEQTQTQNNKKDSQQDTRLDSLQTAVDSLNSQVSAINASIQAINSSIDDKYSAQTQTLMSALSSQIEALSSSLASVVSTAQVSANVGNFKRLAATISATITSLSAEIATITEKATVEEAEINTLDVNIANVGTLAAVVVNLETVNAELLNVTSFIVASLTVENLSAENVDAENIDADVVDSDKVKTRNITGKEWHTPISTPDNTELLHISIPKYDGSVQILTMNDEFNINIANNYFVAFNQSGEYIYRIERGENSTDIYLMNVGDTINYSILWIGSESHGTVTSEIVDRTQYRQNITTHEGILDIELVITNIEILFTDYLPAAGESNILYVIKTQGAYLWNEERSEFIPLMGTDWQDWIGDLTQLTTTAKTSLVDAVNELDSEKYDKTGGNISGDVVVEGLTTLKNDAFAEKNLKVKGDLIVEGQSLITDEQTLAIDSNYAVLRKNNPSGLASGEKSGVVIHNYQTGKNASIAVSADGEFRVSDNVAETTTSYTNIAKFGDDYYTGLDPSTSATVVSGATVSEDVDEVGDCVLETTGGKWYHFYNSSWYEMYLDSNVLTFDQSDPITDSTLITTLEALTKKNLFYFRSLSVLVISDATDQPLLTREEAEDLQNNDLFMWDATNRKATKVPRPTADNQIIKASLNNGAVSYSWTAMPDITNVLSLAHPIGSLYWTSSAENPATTFGFGTWKQIKDKFIWAKGDNDTVNATGGAKTVTLIVENLPSHSHSFTPSGSISVTTNPTFTGSEHSHTYTPSGSISVTTNPTFTGSAVTSGAMSGDNYARWNKYTPGDAGSSGRVSITDYSGSTQTLSSYPADAKWTDINLSHTHSVTAKGTISGGAYKFTGTEATLKATQGGTISGGAYKFTGTEATTGETGSGTAVDKMPPYVVKYCWERTA